MGSARTGGLCRTGDAVSESRCKHCGFRNQATARFCGGCGRSAEPPTIESRPIRFVQSDMPAALAERIAQSGNAMLGERKRVTVLFADVRGSTALIDQLDPEQALGLLGPVMKVLMDAVHQHDGFVNQTRGDGIMALFGAPLANEDHAIRACQAAMAMRAGVGALFQEGQPESGSAVSLRIGIHSGEVVIHSIGRNLTMNYDAVGKTVHLAARMEELAAPGQIMLTSATVELAEGFIETAPLGSMTVRGVSEPVETFELIDTLVRTRWQVRSARGLSAIVGRQAELRALRSAFDSAAAGKGRLVTIVGPPGIGKSRLVHEFVNTAAAGGWTVLETACASQHMNSSYYPISRLIRTLFNIGIDDSPEIVARRVEEGVGSFYRALASSIPAILSMLDLRSDDNLAPPARRLQVIEAIKALIFHVKRKSPLLILIEDLHWADAETKLILENIAGLLGETRILLMVTQRPESTWSVDRAHLRVDLFPLKEQDSHSMVDWLMGDDISLNPVKRRILAQAQGNPLFIEELVQALKDSGATEGEPRHYRLTQSTRQIDMPETIHSVLATRVDLLDARSKSLLQTCAVIGKDAPAALLSRMMETDVEELAPQLRTLERADLLYKVGGSGGPEYSFKHDLTRDVAYGTLLVGMRRILHAKAVDIIEANFGNRLEEHIDRLADHAFYAERWEKAVPYQLHSCRRAVRRGANHDAVSIFERGIETLSHLSPSEAKTKAEIDFRLLVILALEPLGRHRRIVDVLLDARRFAEDFADRRRLAAVNCHLAIALWRLGDFDDAMAAAEAAKAIAEAVDSKALMFAALNVTGIAHHGTGSFAKTVEMHRKCILLETPELDDKRAGWPSLPGVVLRTFLADALLELGEIDEAAAIAEEGGRRADAADHAYSRAQINHIRSRIRLAQGRPAEAILLLQDAWQVSIDLELIQMYPMLAARWGEAYLAAGDFPAALDIVSLPEKLDPLAQNMFGWGLLFVAQGRALLAVGRHGEARAAAERALRLAEQRGERAQQAYALKLLGEISASADGDSAEAEGYLKRAITLAEECGMTPLKKACATALAAIAGGRTVPQLALHQSEFHTR
jgi:class 3 adenylate cyclase/tetratricopeptide (TPR) repeat protein